MVKNRPRSVSKLVFVANHKFYPYIRMFGKVKVHTHTHRTYKESQIDRDLERTEGKKGSNEGKINAPSFNSYLFSAYDSKSVACCVFHFPNL